MNWLEHLSWVWALRLLALAVILTCIACVREARRIPRERLPKPTAATERTVYRDYKGAK